GPARASARRRAEPRADHLPLQGGRRAAAHAGDLGVAGAARRRREPGRPPPERVARRARDTGACAGGGRRHAGAPRATCRGRAVTFTVSTWGGITQDGIKAHVQPEFERQTGATIVYDIGGQGARYNKILAQRANPTIDVFFTGEEAVVAGLRAGVLMPANRKN